MNEQQIYNFIRGNEYNDQFNRNDRYTMELFRPDSMVSQSDLNEEQSFLHDQFRMFGDYLFQNGAIISGLHLTIGASQKTKKSNLNLDQAEVNRLGSADISAVNSVINKDDYLINGSVNVAPDSETADDYPGIEMYVHTLPKQSTQTGGTAVNTITISFGITQQTGRLQNISFDYPNTARITNILVDGQQSGSTSLVTDLDDGRTHSIAVTIQTGGNPTLPIYLVANSGHDMQQGTNAVRFQISSLMVNTGSTAQTWRSPTSDDISSTGERDIPVVIGAGYVYLNGYIRYFNGGSTTITGNGKEVLGLTADYNPIEQWDTTKGAVSQGERMADKVRYSLSLTYNSNNPDSIPIYTLQNGRVASNNASTGNAHLDAILAQRTYDQSGSFLVSGMDFHTENDPDVTNGGLIDINKGVAYVMGYGIYKTQPSKLPFRIPTQTQTRLDEPLSRDQSIQSESSDDINKDLYTGLWTSYPLEFQPVKADSIRVDGAAQVGGTDFMHPLLNSTGSMGAMITTQNNEKTWEFNNSMEFPTNDGYQSLMPNVFQARESSLGGGSVGDLRVYQTDDSHNIQAAITIKTDGTNLVSKVANSKWGDMSALEDYDLEQISYQGMDCAVIPAGQGISQNVISGKYYLAFNFPQPTGEAQGDLEDAIFGHDESGSTLYLCGIANYYYTGPSEASSGELPDYVIKFDSSNQKSGLVSNLKNGDVALQNARIVFNAQGTTGVTPPLDTDETPYILNVTYSFYLARVGIITLDQQGNFSLIEGNPAPLGEARPPEQHNQTTLRIGYVTELPDTYKSNCQYSTIKRIPFWGLDDLATRVSNLEMSLQNVLMNVQSKNNIDPTTINDVLDDDFTTFAAADLSYAVSGRFNIAYDLAHGIISVPDIPSSVQAVYPQLGKYAFHQNNNDVTQNNTYTLWNNALTGACIDATVPQEWQTTSTGGVIALNGSIDNGSANGLLKISPNGDDFIDCADFDFKNAPHQQLHNWYSYTEQMTPKSNNFNNLKNSYSFGKGYDQQALNQWSMRGATGRRTASTGNEYTHSRVVHFQTNWLAPNTSGYHILINGQDLPEVNTTLDNFGSDTEKELTQYPFVTDDNGDTTYQTIKNGTLNGHDDVIKVPTGLKTDETGSLSGFFTLPDNLSTGAIKITLTNGNGTNQNPNISSVSAIYNANGIDNYDTGSVDEDTVEHAYTATDSQNQTVDPPIAQVVRVRQSSTLTGVNLDIQGDKTTRSSNVLVQLRSVDANGEPTSRVLAQSTVSGSHIASNVTSQTTTDFMFDDPVFIHAGELIAITVYTDYIEHNSLNSQQSGYTLSVGRTNGTQVTSQPSVNSRSSNDMAMYQSNGTGWKKNQLLMLDFQLYRGRFLKDDEIAFQPINLNATGGYYDKLDNGENPAINPIDSISKFALLVNYITPENTSISWKIRLGSNVNGHDDFTVFPINRRRQIQKISDRITNSAEADDNSETPNGTGISPVTSLQLFCDFHYDDNDSRSIDEAEPAYLRVSPMLNYGTLALALSEANNTQGQSEHLAIDYTDPDNQSNIIKYMNEADGLYISRNILTTYPNYNTIITSFDVHEDSGHSKVVPIYSTDKGQTWNLYSAPQKGDESDQADPYLNGPKINRVDHDFDRYTYKTVIPEILKHPDTDYSDKSANNFKMGLIFLTDSPYSQPMVRRLSNTLTLEDGFDDNNNLPFGGDYDDTGNIKSNDKIFGGFDGADMNDENDNVSYNPNLGDTNLD